MPPAARDELVKAVGDKITVRRAIWNVASGVTPNHKLSRSTTRASAGIDPGDRPMARRAGAVESGDVKTVGGIVYPGSPLAANQQELEQIAGGTGLMSKNHAPKRSGC